MRSSKKLPIAAAALLCSLVLTLGSASLPVGASVAQSKVVSANPQDATPNIVLGTLTENLTVYALAQVGSTIYAGGRFTQVQDHARTTTYARSNFVAFDATTGAIRNVPLAFDRTVQTIVPSADQKSLYIGGSFKAVNGVAHKAMIRFNLATNQIDPTFNPPTNGGTVTDAVLVNGRLIVSGTLTGYLLALSPTTGANTGYIHTAISGVENTSDVTKVLRFAVNPAGSRLVAIGNWATVDGLPRKWAFELDLGATTSALNTWHGSRLDVPCLNKTENVAQGVDFSPDGSYFVIVSTGGPTGTGNFCDAAGRYDTANVAPTAGVRWVNYTGGDSLYAVAITGAAVYVGGHPRWLDNPYGKNTKGAGAVDRLGVGAIDPVSGMANSWNPGKTRNHGVQKFLATPSGLWVGSDGQYFASEYHAGIAFCPLTK